MDSADLAPVVAAVRNDPSFLAGRVAAADAESELARRLGLDTPRLHRLLLCRPPSPYRFAEDVRAIADLVEADPGALAAALREVDALAALRSSGRTLHLGGGSGLLVAAHDGDDDHVSPSDVAAERLRELAARFWEATPDEVSRERDVEAAVAWSVRLAVVALSRPTLADVRTWLRRRGVPVTGGRDDRAVRGFLVAWRGLGAVFYDGTLEPADRRFTLAHEVGHFLLDYDEPRRRVLRDAPDLLEVVDEVREATASDRARAMLAHVPVGVHTHLLDDEDSPAAGAVEDEASRFALELLAPWDEVLAAARDATAAPRPYRDALDAIAGRVAERFFLPRAAAGARARQALDELGVRPGFFDT